MVTHINFEICGHRTALSDLSRIDCTIWVYSATSPDYKSAARGRFNVASDWRMGWSGRERYSKCHWPSAQASPYLHSATDGYEYSLWQKL